MRHWLLVAAFSVLLSTTGCASGISSWIVKTRNHQGDVALLHGNSADASIAFQLALRVDPENSHARTGLVGVQARIAPATLYRVTFRRRRESARRRKSLRAGRRAHRSLARADRTSRDQARYRRVELPVVSRNGRRIAALVRAVASAGARHRHDAAPLSTIPTTAASSRKRSGRATNSIRKSRDSPIASSNTDNSSIRGFRRVRIRYCAGRLVASLP